MWNSFCIRSLSLNFSLNGRYGCCTSFFSWCVVCKIIRLYYKRSCRSLSVVLMSIILDKNTSKFLKCKMVVGQLAHYFTLWIWTWLPNLWDGGITVNLCQVITIKSSMQSLVLFWMHVCIALILFSFLSPFSLASDVHQVHKG